MTRALFYLTWVMAASAATGNGRSACSPIPDTSDTGPTDVTLESGRLEDDQIALDWRVYNAWDGGACLDLKFTNLGERVKTWRFDVGVDQVVETLSYPGPAPSSLSVVLDGLRIVPWAEPQLLPYGTVSYPLCAEPVVRPTTFDAQVERDAADATVDTGAQIYGYTKDDTETMMLTWLSRSGDDGPCLEMRVANISDRDIADWSLRIEMDRPYRFVSTDTGFFYFPVNLSEMDMLPTDGTKALKAAEIRTGLICTSPLAVPLAIRSSFVFAPPPDGTSAPPAQVLPGLPHLQTEVTGAP